MSNITPAEHLAEVLSRFDDAPDARLAEIMKCAIRHMHEFVLEVGLTREEWFASMKALADIGHMCDEKRQEFILLSDTLGVSMLVEMINQMGAEGTTEPTVFGPFHVEGATPRQMGDSIVVDPMDADEPLTILGEVSSLGGGPIEGATLDVWQAASNGFYDVQDSDQTPLNMRGIFTTGADGRYEVRTVRPVSYPVPDDGPAGALLHATGRHNWRPAHVHFVVSAPAHKTVITHLFDSQSDFLDSDVVFGVRDSLIVDMNGGRCDYDFVLEPSA